MGATKKGITILLSSFILLLILSNTAYGITGNSNPDSTPYVGIVVLFSDEARQEPIGYSTGILLSKTVMLTAGHSCLNAPWVSVCFDKGPMSYSIVNGKLTYSTDEPVYNGITLPYPEYVSNVLSGETNGNKILSASDLGLIFLDEPVEGITEYAVLPTAGFVDSLSAGTDLSVAGYGAQYRATPRNNRPDNSWVTTLSCNTAPVRLLSQSFENSNKYLKCTANPSQGKGGIAFGDSGGPVLYNTEAGEIVIAINSYVNNNNCAGTTYHCRIDEPQVLGWITGFL